MMKINEIKLIKMPNLPKEKSYKSILMPDLGLGILVSILKKDGFMASQWDLKMILLKNSSLRKIQEDFHNNSKNSIKAEFLFLAESIVKAFHLKNSKIIGFSFDEDTDLKFNLILIKLIKEITRAKVVLGGNYGFSELFLEKYGFLDFIIRGDATISLSMLLQFLNGQTTIREIYGLIFRNGTKVMSNPYLRQAGNVNLIPDFSNVNMEDYKMDLASFAPELSRTQFNEIYNPDIKINVIPYHFIKGCPNACMYCCWNKDHYFQTTPPEKVAENLQFMKEKYKTDHFIFLNNSFNPTLKYAQELIGAFHKYRLNVLWSDSISPKNIPLDLFAGLKNAGCRQLYFGLESLSPRILKLMNRPGDCTRFSSMLESSHNNGIFNGVNFLMGIPSETTQDIEKTHNFILKYKPYYEYFNINLLRMIPEFKTIKNLSKMNITLKKLGSLELRNPEHKEEINQILKKGGITDKIRFYSFDENSGLKWQDKNEQDIKLLKRLLDVSDDIKKTFFEDIRFVFYLNHIFKSKNRMMSWFKQIVKDKRKDT